MQSRLEERAAKAIESPMFVEQFRRASATLIEAQAAGNLKVLLVASASPGDGKTLTALNLALVLGRSYGRRVLLIDGDLRRTVAPSNSRRLQPFRIDGCAAGRGGRQARSHSDHGVRDVAASRASRSGSACAA